MRIKFKTRISLSLLAFFGVFLFSNTAFAQSSGLSGFDLYYFQPKISPGKTIFVETSKTIEKGKLATKLSHDWRYRQILKVGSAGGDRDAVKSLYTANYMIAYGITDFWDVGVALPVHINIRGDVVATGASYSATSFGDLQFCSKIKLIKQNSKKERPGVALVLQASAPTGSTSKFTGNSRASTGADLVISHQNRLHAFAFNVGFKENPKTTVQGVAFNDHLRYGVAYAKKLSSNHRVWLGGEITGVVQTKSSTSPQKAYITLTKMFGSGTSVSLAGGVSLNNAVGNANANALISISKIWNLKRENHD